MQKPLLTIGIPIYKGGKNGGSPLIRCLNSLKDQTFTNFKVILANNDSPDNTEGIIYNIVKDDKRFEYHRNTTNFGYIYNVFKIVTSCDTKYFSELHFDSYWAPTYADKCIKALEKYNDYVLAYSYCQFIDNDNQLLDIYKDSIPFDDNNPVNRYSGIVSRMGWCIPFHGIMRHKNAAKHYLKAVCCTNAAFDNQLLALMALDGKFMQLSEPLFYRLKDEYQTKGESQEDHFKRLYLNTSFYQKDIYLPFCWFIKDHCRDIADSLLTFEEKDYLISTTVKTLLTRYKNNINFELNRLIDLIISGKFKYSINNIEDAPPNKYKYLDFVYLTELSSDLCFVLNLLPTFPRLNLALSSLYMYMGKHKDALFYIEKELSLNQNDKLALTLKNTISSLLNTNK
jgi:glycosyltransferase involved in cell wall biosynthesis